MIEAIYKGEDNNNQKNSEAKVPKNVRQIGEITTNRIIYIEDYVMSHLKDSQDNTEKIKYGVLLGNVRKNAGNTYVFVKGLVEVLETIENSLIFNDEIWTGIYQDIKDYFDNFEIVGWYVSMPYRIKDDMAPIRKIHLDNFAGNDKVCYVDDRSENDDGFYVFEKGRMEKQSGYYIYYEKNPNMQKYINKKINKNVSQQKKEVKNAAVKRLYSKNDNEESLVKKVVNMTPGFLKNTAKTEEAEKNIPKQEQSKKNKKQSSIKPGYAIGTVAVIALLLSTIVMMNNYGELKNIQQSLEELANESRTVAVIGQVSDNLDDEVYDENSSDVSINSDASEENDDSSSESESAEEMTSTAQSTTNTRETTTSNLNGTAQGTYEDSDSTASSAGTENYCIVKNGQTLYDISMTYYNTSLMVDAIKEANGIDDNYTIYEGEKIILP